jgi:hypothetical protein
MRSLLKTIFSFISRFGRAREKDKTGGIDWEEVDELLKKHIQSRSTVEQGIEDIRQFLSKGNNQKLVEGINISQLTEEFNDFVQKTLLENPLPANIKSISFGIFTMKEKGRELTTFYLCGSDRTPVEDELDWAVDPAYFPTSYCVPKDFDRINKKYPRLSGDEEVLVFNGILNLLVINHIKDYSDHLLKSRDSLYVGAGFDAGDIYVLGQFTRQGIK